MNNTIYRGIIEDNKQLVKLVHGHETIISLLLKLIKEDCSEDTMLKAYKIYKDFKIEN
jgi:hypothetical protein